MKRQNSIIFLILLIILNPFPGITQSAQIEWQKCLGGSDEDYAISITRSFDGGYVLAGRTSSSDFDVSGYHDNGDYWIVKTDSIGSIQWQNCFGGSFHDYPYAIKQTLDSGYIVVGESASTDGNVTGNHGFEDCWVIKLDSSGNLQWEKSLGGSWHDGGKDVLVLADGFLVLAVASSTDGDISSNHGMFNDYWLVKLDINGTLIWEKSLGGGDSDVPFAFKETSDGGFIVGGYSNSTDFDVTGNHGSRDFWIVKTDSTGSIEWEKSLGGSGIDIANSIAITSDNGSIVAGWTISTDGNVTGNHGGTDSWVVKLDSVGGVEWEKALGGTLNEGANSVIEYNSLYYIGNSAFSTDGDLTNNYGEHDAWIVALNLQGNIQWEKTFGGSLEDNCTSILDVNNDKMIFSGYTFSNDSDVTGNHGVSDFWLVKLSVPGIVTNSDVIEHANLNFYPNPVKGQLYFKEDLIDRNNIFVIYNIYGQKLEQVVVGASRSINLSHLENGIYICKLKSCDSETSTVVIKTN